MGAMTDRRQPAGKRRPSLMTGYLRGARDLVTDTVGSVRRYAQTHTPDEAIDDAKTLGVRGTVAAINAAADYAPRLLGQTPSAAVDEMMDPTPAVKAAIVATNRARATGSREGWKQAAAMTMMAAGGMTPSGKNLRGVARKILPHTLPNPDGASAALDMSQAARMGRAAEQGFTTPAYHGTGRDFTDFDISASETTLGSGNSRAAYFSPEPHVASAYAGNVAGEQVDPYRKNIGNAWAPRVLPVQIKADEFLADRAGTYGSDQIYGLIKRAGDPERRTGYALKTEWPALQKWWQTKFGEELSPNVNVMDALKAKGFRGMSDGGDEIAAFYPSQDVRSQFDPFHPGGEARIGLPRPGDFRAQAPEPPVSAPPSPSGPISPPVSDGITAYHGSPHTFDKFDLSKIGTGEGAQAYGHGIYLAENEGVARAYRDALKKDGKLNSATDRFNHLMLDGQPIGRQFDIDTAWTDEIKGLIAAKDDAGLTNMLRDRGARWQEVAADAEYPFPDYAKGKIAAYDGLLKRLEAGGKIHDAGAGSMYQVRINADPNDFLDWDAPLSGQSEKVRQSIDSLGVGHRTLFNEGADIFGKPKTVGHGIQGAGHLPGRQSNVSDALRDAGLPGIKYLDQGSRGAGEGSRNFVVFNPQIIDIMKRYGVAAPVAAAMLANSQGREPTMTGRETFR